MMPATITSRSARPDSPPSSWHIQRPPCPWQWDEQHRTRRKSCCQRRGGRRMAGSHSLPLFSGPRRTRANIARSCRPLCCACKPGTGVSGDCGLTRDSYSTLGHLINLDTHYTSTIFASSFHVFVSRFGSLSCGFTRYSCFTLGHVYLHAHDFTIFVSSFRVFVFRFWSLFIFTPPPPTPTDPPFLFYFLLLFVLFPSHVGFYFSFSFPSVFLNLFWFFFLYFFSFRWSLEWLKPLRIIVIWFFSRCVDEVTLTVTVTLNNSRWKTLPFFLSYFLKSAHTQKIFAAKKRQKHSEHVFSKFVQHRWVLRITVAMGCRELLPPYAIHLQQYKSPTWQAPVKESHSVAWL